LTRFLVKKWAKHHILAQKTAQNWEFGFLSDRLLAVGFLPAILANNAIIMQSSQIMKNPAASSGVSFNEKSDMRAPPPNPGWFENQRFRFITAASGAVFWLFPHKMSYGNRPISSSSEKDLILPTPSRQERLELEITPKVTPADLSQPFHPLITRELLKAVVWPDAAFGCPQPGDDYSHAPVDRYQVILQIGGVELDYWVPTLVALSLSFGEKVA
jgi:hypothetical protein